VPPFLSLPPSIPPPPLQILADQQLHPPNLPHLLPPLLILSTFPSSSVPPSSPPPFIPSFHLLIPSTSFLLLIPSSSLSFS
ncbi:hypothetical protein Pcinc_011627, partial [Petrolisthes cinctipes]